MSVLTLNLKAMVDFLRGSKSSNSNLLTPAPITAETALLNETVNQYLRDELAVATITIRQLNFLLAQAPMIDAPTDKPRLVASKTPFAYIHPKTLSKFTWGLPPSQFYKFPPSPTMYVLTSLMPEGRILYSPFQIPGLERTLAS